MALKYWQKYWFALAVLVVLGLILIPKMQTPTKPLRITCTNLQQKCDFKLGEQSYSLRSLQAIGTRGFFTLELEGQAEQVLGSWQMLAMDMGPNQYRFLSAKTKLWQARMALPLCTQARQDWLLQLEIDGRKIEIMTSSAAL